MDISLILKIGGIGLLVSVICQVLSKSGRDDQAMLVSIAGIIIVLMFLIKEFSSLINSIKSIFGL
ncbi:MAG: stage III sporulation protein AC [Clostridia bacterium]|nr:stage III sporulation protein AC [Clostridia bacterium]